MGEDGKLYPEIQISNEKEHDQPLGSFGKQAMMYLQENDPIRFSQLQMEGTLMEKMHQVDQEAKEKIINLMEQLEKKNPSPKTENIHQITAHKNQLKAQAEEIVLKEFIYQKR
ncbi:TnpV protein [Virgibacillus sp.]|uniref:TnpV protein n=1 Tax=Virgibacillus sp. TaxID=1872700 RepID=UPI00345B7350